DFDLCHNIDIEIACKIIVIQLKSWCKNQKVTKSKVFTKKEIAALHVLPNTPEMLWLKTYCTIAFAARGGEVIALLFKDLESTEVRGAKAFIVHYERLKYLKSDKQGKLVQRSPKINQVGKNKASEAGKEIAALLGLPEPHRYTEHCFRRTSITFMCNSGMTAQQMKGVSGHKSTTVLEGYIARSDVGKLHGSMAISLESGSVLDGPVTAETPLPLASAAPRASAAPLASAAPRAPAAAPAYDVDLDMDFDDDLAHVEWNFSQTQEEGPSAYDDNAGQSSNGERGACGGTKRRREEETDQYEDKKNSRRRGGGPGDQVQVYTAPQRGGKSHRENMQQLGGAGYMRGHMEQMGG
ncbi:hypothetical protein B484DRAFT_409489, partial [Ochromonadaceae sp. CCMP2298]